MILNRIWSSSYGSSRYPVDEVPKEVKDQLKDLKEVAEGDAKPEREATSQGGEQTSILDVSNLKSKSFI